MPGACQSRAVTEPQREKARLKLDKPPQKGLMYQDFRAKLYFECFQNTRRISTGRKVYRTFLPVRIVRNKTTVDFARHGDYNAFNGVGDAFIYVLVTGVGK